MAFSTVTWICSSVSNDYIKREANLARRLFAESDSQVIGRLLYSVEKEPDTLPLQRIEKIAAEMNISVRAILSLKQRIEDENLRFLLRVAHQKYYRVGIFNEKFVMVLRNTLKTINNLVKKGTTTINTAIISKEYSKTEYFDNTIRNIIVDCLIVLKNFGVIKLIRKPKCYEYSVPKNEVDIDGFIKSFQEEKDMKKIFKNFKKYRF